jgi:hypothetical protein
MSDDVFGQLTFSMFVEVPSIQFYRGKDADSFVTREKRVKLATIHCRRSESETYFAEFKSGNARIADRIVAEFSFREML